MEKPPMTMEHREVHRINHTEVFEVFGSGDHLVTVMDGDWAVCEEHGRVESCAHVEAINEWLNNGEVNPLITRAVL